MNETQLTNHVAGLGLRYVRLKLESALYTCQRRTHAQHGACGAYPSDLDDMCLGLGLFAGRRRLMVVVSRRVRQGAAKGT